MARAKQWSASILFLVALLGGCATGKPRGFLSNYADMKPQLNFDKAYLAPGTRFGQYHTLVLEVVNKAGTSEQFGEEKLRLFAERLQWSMETAIRRTGVFQEILTNTNAAGPETLRLRVYITVLDPGSQALRFWVGMGAGTARFETEGEAIDPTTGSPIFRFVDARSGGDLLGLEGSEELMKDDLSALAEAVAAVFAAHG